MVKDYYKVLGINKNAGINEIKKAYRRLAGIYHPDRHPGGDDKMVALNEAYSILSNPIRRMDYDRQIAKMKKTSVEKKPDMGFFSFSPYDILDKYGDILPALKYTNIAVEGFDEVIKAKKPLKTFLLFFKVAEKIDDVTIRNTLNMIESHLKKHAYISSETHLVFIMKEGITSKSLSMIKIPETNTAVSFFDYKTGRLHRANIKNIKIKNRG
jgi:hypothetical protein